MKVCRPLISSKKGNVVYIMTQAEKRSICEQLIDKAREIGDADLIVEILKTCIKYGYNDLVVGLQRK
jgi:hypothetical protein